MHLSQPNLEKVLFLNSLVKHSLFEFFTGIFPEKYFTVVVKNMCPFCVSGFGVFLRRVNFPFLHIKIAHKYLGNIYVDP